jgi:hypothetical protein
MHTARERVLQDVQYCFNNVDLCNDWEVQFLFDLPSFSRPSPRQLDKLNEIVAKIYEISERQAEQREQRRRGKFREQRRAGR